MAKPVSELIVNGDREWLPQCETGMWEFRMTSTSSQPPKWTSTLPSTNQTSTSTAAKSTWIWATLSWKPRVRTSTDCSTWGSQTKRLPCTCLLQAAWAKPTTTTMFQSTTVPSPPRGLAILTPCSSWTSVTADRCEELDRWSIKSSFTSEKVVSRTLNRFSILRCLNARLHCKENSSWKRSSKSARTKIRITRTRTFTPT